MSFAWPQALLLAIPLGLFLWKGARMAGWPQVLRALVLGALVVALARPEFRFRAAGADVVVVVDRSRSMPAGGEARAEELIRLLASQRREGGLVLPQPPKNRPVTELLCLETGRHRRIGAWTDRIVKVGSEADHSHYCTAA